MMSTMQGILVIFMLLITLMNNTCACPSENYFRFDGVCYEFNFEQKSIKEAKKKCQDEGTDIASFRDKMPEELEHKLSEILRKLIEKQSFWIGFEMKDRKARQKSIEEREWTFHIDETTVVQKDFEVWAEEPTDPDLNCAAVNSSKKFEVQAVDCGGPALFFICEKKSKDSCADKNHPYFIYGDQCLVAQLSYFEHKYIKKGCDSGTPASVKNEASKKNIEAAVMNAFIGGILITGLEKYPDGVFRNSDGTEPNKNLWAEGEPRDENSCVGVSWHHGDKLKLKTIDCDVQSAFMCAVTGNVSQI